MTQIKVWEKPEDIFYGYWIFKKLKLNYIKYELIITIYNE